MSNPPNDFDGRGAQPGGAFFKKLRDKLGGGMKAAHAETGHKLPPIADVVAKAGRPARDKA